MLYPSTLLQDFPCGKEKLFAPKSRHNLTLLTRGVQNNDLFGFAQVDIEVPGELHDKFSEMIPDEQIPDHMHEYLKKTGRKRIPVWCDESEKDLALYTCSQVAFGSRIESDGLLSVL